MFENILHAPLQLHIGASQAARSLLEGLLERHVSKRLGGSHDLVSVQQAMMHINTPNHSGSNFSVYPGGAAGTFFLCIHQLERPPSQENYPPVHPKSGKSDSEVSREHFFISMHSVCSFLTHLQTGPCDVSYIDPEFTIQPVPASVNERWQGGATCTAFPGFSFMNPVEYVVS